MSIYSPLLQVSSSNISFPREVTRFDGDVVINERDDAYDYVALISKILFSEHVKDCLRGITIYLAMILDFPTGTEKGDGNFFGVAMLLDVCVDVVSFLMSVSFLSLLGLLNSQSVTVFIYISTFKPESRLIGKYDCKRVDWDLGNLFHFLRLLCFQVDWMDWWNHLWIQQLFPLHAFQP